MDTSLESLTPDTRAAAEMLLQRAAELGYQVKVRSTKRSCAEQNQLYALGRSAPGQIVTYARGCSSWHVLGRALDITIAHALDGPYQELAAYWKQLGGRWGGDFPGQAASLRDVGHFEWHPGMAIEDLCVNPSACGVDEDRNQRGVMPPGAPLLAAAGPTGAEVFAAVGVVGLACAVLWAASPKGRTR